MTAHPSSRITDAQLIALVAKGHVTARALSKRAGITEAGIRIRMDKLAAAGKITKRTAPAVSVTYTIQGS